jgi:histidine ammonia-lyase
LPGPPFWVPVYKLKAGESLPLINGTHFMTSLLAHSVYRAEILSRTADVCAAMGIEALTGNYKSFDEKLGQLRPHWGQMQTADNLRSLLQGGNRSPRILQDPYSLRCASQVHGVAKEEVARAKEVVEKEINSVTGNPIIYEDELCHGGNFHGQVLAHAADALCIALSVLASISERRVDRFFHAPALPMFLVKESGPNSGLMVAQYTAAALVSENKTLAHPASVDSIPVACGQEDIVSMGGWAVRKLREICRNTGYVLAIELLCAAQALDFCEIDPDSNIAKIHRLVRLRVSYLDSDRILAKDIETIFEFIYSGEFLKEVEVIMGGRSE